MTFEELVGSLVIADCSALQVSNIVVELSIETVEFQTVSMCHSCACDTSSYLGLGSLLLRQASPGAVHRLPWSCLSTYLH
jgi:hypothetical protein